MTGGLPVAVAETAEAFTGAIRSVRPVVGGCIAHATRVEAARGVFFLKWAVGSAGERFSAEAAGLGALAAAAPAGIRVPAVVAARDGDEGTPGVMLTDWVEPGRPDRAYDARFGEALAELHRAPAGVPGAEGPYGFAVDNTIGATPQANGWMEAWPAFFRDRRLAPMVERVRVAGRWRRAWDEAADRLLGRLEQVLPERPHPSVLHGDLWSGNAYPATGGRAVLVDPAAYVGDREADLAMTELFGGFGAAFYEAYRAAWPLEPGYESDGRQEIYQLYHLLNHLLLFGEGYAGGVERALLR